MTNRSGIYETSNKLVVNIISYLKDSADVDSVLELVNELIQVK